MIKKKKYKIKKKNLLILLLFVILTTSLLFYFLRDTTKEKLKHLGYSKEEINIIYEKKLDTDILLNYEYIDKLLEFVNNKDYVNENLANYLDIYSEDRDVFTIIYIINNNIDYEYSDKLYSLINSKYFILDNLERYFKYEKQSDADLIIRDVNSNLDYEYYTNIEPVDVSKGLLLLVNKYYELDSEYYYGELVTVSSEYSVKSGQMLSKEAYEAFKALVKAGEKDGVYVRNLSAYRSYDTQYGLYSSYKKSNGVVWADKWSARAGHSEHQTGLALDVCSKGTWTFDKFENSKEFVWMKDNSYKYGFILRYPLDKTDITGYGYEPWHYRYVGVDAATYIYENDITYEEYYAYFVK